jgi:endonuclease YncB( thermonuclease family)
MHLSSPWRSRASIAAAVLVIAALLGPAQDAGADAVTRVFINGRPTPVSFNDGDSFRPSEGELAGQQCRLVGYNTLESFGPAHQWGDWHPYELYINAKMATVHARRGTWHCNFDGNFDTYGRAALDCPDLAVDMIRHGFAMAYTIDDHPSRPEYLRAQREAIREHRGMWAHGVPEFVMTSVHSYDEDRDREWHYNRLISTVDGHSESMQHRDTYGECQWVCNTETVVSEGALRHETRAVRADPTLAPLVAGMSNVVLTELVSRFGRRGALPDYLDPSIQGPLTAYLGPVRDAGRLPTHEQRGSCGIYVPFDRRYGRSRASCLMGHGTLPPDMADRWHGGH